MLRRIRDDAGGLPGDRGRLRVYLGMAPGVGKTYKMLEEGHRRLERGTDVVVGFVEAHGRPLTTALVTGLEVVPRRQIEYRGVIVEEMDTDAVIARHPRVALVDELAHTNAPGSPREKRWQDVALILEAGITVISTLNVQHLESVAEAVETITGAPVRERLPDEVLARADEVELVDMSPHALRQRMRHGNVYPPDRTRIALDRFFTEANLTALRELALRFTAGQVDEQLQTIGGPLAAWPVTERLLVVLEPERSSHRVIRRAAALAGVLHGELLVASVATPALDRLGRDRQEDLRQDERYAEDLGAVVVRTEAPDLVTGVVDLARHHHVTQVVVAHHPQRGLARLGGDSLADRIRARLATVDVVLVPPEEG